MFDLFNNQIPDTLNVRVTAKAAANRLKLDYQADGQIILIRAYITAVAENGLANKMLSEQFALPINSLTITHGLSNKNKIIAIKQ